MAVKVTGTDSYASWGFSHWPNGTTDMTFACWYLRNSSVADSSAIWGTSRNLPGGLIFHRNVQDVEFAWKNNSGTGYGPAVYSSVITAVDVWHHVAFRLNTSEGSVWVDGVKGGTTITSWTGTLSEQTTYSARYGYAGPAGWQPHSGTSYFYNGAFWLRSLSDSEILSLHKGLHPLNLRPHRYYPTYNDGARWVGGAHTLALSASTVYATDYAGNRPFIAFPPDVMPVVVSTGAAPPAGKIRSMTLLGVGA